MISCNAPGDDDRKRTFLEDEAVLEPIRPLSRRESGCEREVEAAHNRREHHTQRLKRKQACDAVRRA
jgi:hypothetical protein